MLNGTGLDFFRKERAMAIRPIDMQIMTPRMADLSMLNQAEKERPLVEQLHITGQQNKETDKNMQIVRKTPEHSQMKNDADAKDKGKNTYTYHPSKKNPGKMQKEEEASFAGGHRLDIKI